MSFRSDEMPHGGWEAAGAGRDGQAEAVRRRHEQRATEVLWDSSSDEWGAAASAAASGLGVAAPQAGRARQREEKEWRRRQAEEGRRRGRAASLSGTEQSVAEVTLRGAVEVRC